jgi:hypothetical protein
VIAESIGALCAVEFCRDLGLQEIILEGTPNPNRWLRAINTDEALWCRLWQIVEDIRGSLLVFRRTAVAHIQRAGGGANCVAHGLAKFAVQEIIYKFWMQEISIL